MTEQPNLGGLLREASERLAEAQDKVDAAQLLEREREAKLRDSFRNVVRAIAELADVLEERVK
jgi:hypothetical protein